MQIETGMLMRRLVRAVVITVVATFAVMPISAAPAYAGSCIPIVGICGGLENRDPNGHSILVVKNWCENDGPYLDKGPNANPMMPWTSGCSGTSGTAENPINPMMIVSVNEATPAAEDWDGFRVNAGCRVTWQTVQTFPYGGPYDQPPVDMMASGDSRWVRFETNVIAEITSINCVDPPHGSIQLTNDNHATESPVPAPPPPTPPPAPAVRSNPSVDGDNKADLIAQNSTSTYGMRSTGTSFSPPVQYSYQAFYGNVANLVGDVNGDGKADLIALNDGDSYVMLSTGTSFTTPVQYSHQAFYGNVANFG